MIHDYTALERLRDIVDEQIGMQPVLQFEELLDLVEKELARRRRELFVLREAVHQMALAIPAAPLGVAAARSPCVREALAMVRPAANDARRAP